ncbi:MAG TPA: tetratricopeptide repeat protein [Chthoniobacteraceae bacterium]|nr:tetratricopeptide repeat protein [Chthoniobacteraceae bacterium]
MKTLHTVVFALLILPAAHPARAQDALDQLDMDAHQALDQNNAAEAEKDWRELLRIDPKNATAWYNLASTLYDEDGDREKALAAVAQAIRYAPQDPDAYDLRAELYYARVRDPDLPANTINDAILHHEWFDKAVADSAQAIRLRLKGEEHPVEWLKQKAGLARSGCPYEAIACWNAFIALRPGDIAGYLARAEARKETGDITGALADYAAAIRIDPKSGDAHLNRAYLYLDDFKNGRALDLAKGAADLDMVVRLGVPDKGIYLYRGETYEKMGRNREALADFTEAIRLGLERNGREDRALLYGKLNQWDNADAEYTRLIDIAGTSWYYFQRGRARCHLGNWDGAIPDLDTAISTDNGANRVYSAVFMRGCAYYYKGQWDKALAEFNTIVSPADWRGRRAAAWIYATCPDAKYRDAEKALDLSLQYCAVSQWNNARGIDIAAAAYAESGKWAAAVNFEKMALKLAAKKSDGSAAAMQSHLALYEQKKPMREENGPQIRFDIE